jgi:hypothetical protein
VFSVSYSCLHDPVNLNTARRFPVTFVSDFVLHSFRFLYVVCGMVYVTYVASGVHKPRPADVFFFLSVYVFVIPCQHLC